MIENEIAPSPAKVDDNGSAGSPPRQGWFRRSSGPRPPEKRRSRKRAIAETLIGLLIALLLALGVRAFAFQVFFVPSSSMVPTLQVGDRIVVDKFLFDYHSLRPGQIIVFRTPPRAKTDCGTEDGDLVKRVVAIAGETIWSEDNKVIVNDKVQKETYLPAGTQLGSAIPRQTVPKGDVFVLGDNRAISCDSRVWGPLPGKNVVGTVVAIVWKGWHPDVHFF
jgi:signal peptidase I